MSSPSSSPRPPPTPPPPPFFPDISSTAPLPAPNLYEPSAPPPPPQPQPPPFPDTLPVAPLHPPSFLTANPPPPCPDSLGPSPPSHPDTSGPPASYPTYPLYPPPQSPPRAHPHILYPDAPYPEPVAKRRRLEAAANPVSPQPPSSPDKGSDQVEAALTKIKSHISNATKFSKASSLLCQLLQGGMLSKRHRAACFETIKAAFTDWANNCTIPNLRRDYLRLGAAIEASMDLFSKAERAQLEVYHIWAVTQNQLMTDDSFVFSKVLSKIKALVSSLEECSEKDEQVWVQLQLQAGEQELQHKQGFHVEQQVDDKQQVDMKSQVNVKQEVGPQHVEVGKKLRILETPPASGSEFAAGAGAMNDPNKPLHSSDTSPADAGSPGASMDGKAKSGGGENRPIDANLTNTDLANASLADANPSTANPSNASITEAPPEKAGMPVTAEDPFGLDMLFHAPKAKVKQEAKASTAWTHAQMMCAKRQAVVDCLLTAKSMCKHAWARVGVELTIQHALQHIGCFCAGQRQVLLELKNFVQEQQNIRKRGPSAKEVNRDTTSFERARAAWSQATVSHRGKVGSKGDHKSENWLG